MPVSPSEHVLSIIRGSFNFVRNMWKVLPYGVDGGDPNPLKVNADGEIDVNVISGGGTTAAALATVVGTPVAATGLSSDSTWTTLITNSSDRQAKILVIRNWCDKWIEVTYKDGPTGTNGTDIHEYITPWTVQPFEFQANAGYINTDVEVRRFDGTPTLGYVQGTIYY